MHAAAISTIKITIGKVSDWIFIKFLLLLYTSCLKMYCSIAMSVADVLLWSVFTLIEKMTHWFLSNDRKEKHIYDRLQPHLSPECHELLTSLWQSRSKSQVLLWSWRIFSTSCCTLHISTSVLENLSFISPSRLNWATPNRHN